MSAYEFLFVLWKPFINVNDVSSLKILIKSTNSIERIINQNNIHTLNDFKRIS